MNTQKLNDFLENRLKSKTELATQKVELNLMNDIEKKLDSANAKRRKLQGLAKKISNDLNDMQTDYSEILQLAKKAEKAAIDIGAEDARKLFGARGDEAKDYANEVGKAANKIFSAVENI